MFDSRNYKVNSDTASHYEVNFDAASHYEVNSDLASYKEVDSGMTAKNELILFILFLSHPNKSALIAIGHILKVGLCIVTQENALDRRD